MTFCSRPRSRSEPMSGLPAMRSRLARGATRIRCRVAAAGLAMVLAVLVSCIARAEHAGPGSSAEHESYVLVASPDVQLAGVSAADVGRLLLGQRRYWRSGQQVVVLLPASGSAARRYLLERVFRMGEADYRRHTLGQLYRGEIEYAPKAVLSDGEALQYVTSGHGALALVPATASFPNDTHVLRIDGKLPGDPGYLLSH